jgi:hypothetical protein
MSTASAAKGLPSPATSASVKVYVAEGEKDAAKKLGPPATLPLISEAEAPVAVVRFEKTISAFAS